MEEAVQFLLLRSERWDHPEGFQVFLEGQRGEWLMSVYEYLAQKPTWSNEEVMLLSRLGHAIEFVGAENAFYCADQLRELLSMRDDGYEEIADMVTRAQEVMKYFNKLILLDPEHEIVRRVMEMNRGRAQRAR